MMKPFNLEAALKGDPVINTYSGGSYKVTILPNLLHNNSYPVIAIITYDDGSQRVGCYNKEGFPLSTKEGRLYMETKKVWINLYKPDCYEAYDFYGNTYLTKEDADRAEGRRLASGGPARIECVQITI